jgi:hypothetical protein
MIRTCAAVLAVIVSCTQVATCAADEATEAHRLAKATLEAARQGLKNEQTVFRVRELFWWSQRILFAELELCETSNARCESFESHLNRCKEFEEKINQLKRQGALSNQTVMEAHYFRVRAESWLAQEKLAQARGRTPAKPTLPVTSDTLDRR